MSPRADAAAPLERWRGLEALKENLEAFTIALVMALVIKHFVVEAFKIPTGSMEPTLLGEKGNGVGDRILVDKWAYLLSGPDRWDVIVFRFPMNKDKHFIKRVAGVGPEWFRIEQGDVWVRASEDEPWHIATKPRRVRETLYHAVWPPAEGIGADRPDTYWDAGPGWQVDGTDALSFAGGERSEVRFLKRIGATDEDDDAGIDASGELVRDVRIRLRLVPGPGARAALAWRVGEEDEARLALAAAGDEDGSYAGVRRPGRQVRRELSLRLAAGVPLEVELECLDGEVHVHLDGRPVAEIDAKRALDDLRAFEDFTQSFTIEAEGGSLRVESVRIDRDQHYDDDGMYGLTKGDEGLWIPEDRYFALGDNTRRSHDSRKWELIHVPLKDGTEVVYYYDMENPPRHGPDGTTVVDRDGIERTFGPANQDPAGPSRTTERAPFVPRSLVVGRAFCVFWPVFPHFPGRLHFIH